MNYTLSNLPNSGQNPTVFMDIMLNEVCLGKLSIKLFRDVFPAGVENFIGMISSQTYKIENKSAGKHTCQKQTKRTFEGCKFFKMLHNNYLMSGDIYSNTGLNAGTIYNDQPIPALFGDYYYPHDVKGLISLVPYLDETTGEILFDSTFMITLDNVKPNNTLNDLNDNQIVIGQVYSGLDVLDKMNILIKPFAGRKYPIFTIGKTGSHKKMIKRKSIINNI